MILYIEVQNAFCDPYKKGRQVRMNIDMKMSK